MRPNIGGGLGSYSGDVLGNELSPPSSSSTGEIIRDDKSMISINVGESLEGPKGGANVFDNPYINNEFNKLSGAYQSQILQLPPEQRGRVMNEILRRSRQQSGELKLSNISSHDPLNNAFNALPLDKRFVALQGGYNSMAKEFNTLAKKVPDPLVTVRTPTSVSSQLSEKFPLLKVEQKGENKKEEDESISSNDNKTSSSSDDSSSSNDSTKKIINI